MAVLEYAGADQMQTDQDRPSAGTETPGEAAGGSVSDLFTEAQLPRGTIMVVGRTLGGKELAGLIRPGDQAHNNFMITWLLDLIKADG